MRRRLPFAALVLAVVMLGLFVAWLRLSDDVESPAPPAAPPQPAQHAPADASADSMPASARSEPLAGEPATRVASGTADRVVTTAVLFGSVSFAGAMHRQVGHLGLYRDGQRIDFKSLETKGLAFAFAGLQDGTYSLRCEATDHLPIDQEVHVRAPQTRHDIRFEQAWLLAVNVVTPDGKPLGEAMAARSPQRFHDVGLNAIATRTPLTKDLPPSDLREVTAGIGRFRAAQGFRALDNKPMPKQTLGVFALPPGQDVCVSLLLRSVVVATQPVAADQSDVTFTLAPDDLLGRLATVRMRLIDGRNGSPVPKTRVGLSDSQSGGQGTPTGEDGSVQLTNLRPGLLNLDCGTSELSAPPVRVVVPAGGQLDLGDVTLLPPDKITVVVDGLGEGGSCYAYWLEPIPHSGCQVRPIYLGNRADAQERQLHPGRYRFIARDQKNLTETEIDTRTLQGQSVRLVMRPAPVLLLQNRAGDAPLTVTVRNAQGRSVLTRQLSGKWDVNWPLPAGEYTAEIADLAGIVTTKKVTLRADGATLVVP